MSSTNGTTITTHGSCWCGNIQYSFTGEPAQKVICHCLTCQSLTGTAFTTNLMVPSSQFTLSPTNPIEPKTFAKQHDTVPMTLTIHFCPNCGTNCYKEASADEFKGVVLVQAGTVKSQTIGGEEGKEEKTTLGAWGPQAELWTKVRAGWLSPLKGVGQMEEFN